jgi:hypothetical protein
MNNNQWTASGSKESKQEFLSLLSRNGIKAFEGRKTAKKILKFGENIKSIDYNRANKKGSFFISTNKIDNDIMHFNIDNLSLDWVREYILQK